MLTDESVFKLERLLAQVLVSVYPLLWLSSWLLWMNAELRWRYEIDCIKYRGVIKNKMRFDGWLYHQLKNDYGLRAARSKPLG